MITKSSFKDLLIFLDFSHENNVFEKNFPHLNATMSADFSKGKLIFPEQIKGRERNDSFNSPENFVVFECVHHLLNKGYRPEHIELEKEWHLGHDSKSGRADICVTDEYGSMLFIIECKTWGKEFDNAFKDTELDGGQLFSYWQQEQSCKWLVLYSSNFNEGLYEYNAPTIKCSDDPNIELLAKNDKSIKLFLHASTVKEKHEAWKETYGSSVYDDLIFSSDSVAYNIGVKPLLKKDLRDFSPNDKIVNKFEEILRHNNVSDKENAFNRLIALFICKLVDESTKDELDEVEFQYKQGTDTYETLQDRLQRLHRDGMEKFMKEKIYYVSSNYPEWLFSTYTGSKRKKAIEDLQNTIRILKFYSNNDFAFKDVHNKELFYQNGKILVEMVQLFEKYKIVYQSKHQFLGDMFEQLLNKGFKQNEGQFFTPMPITRFIWDCLPIERVVKSDRGTIYPKIIDYACGAGHFLTEAVEAINCFVPSDGSNEWTRDCIYGIEKDYRLARVAKISLFMNSAGEGNIIFGDGLENEPDKGIDNGLFDILVANPPYSVKDFKQHLQLKNNDFQLLNRISANGNEIETLFIERIAQLLKPKGIAAVVLPISILSNDKSSYIGAREVLLNNFLIRAIVSLGSKTFGATGTNTVVLFLEKFNEPPKQIDLAADSINAIFSGKSLKDWKDKDIFEQYLLQINVAQNDYRQFLCKTLSINELKESSYFKNYIDSFFSSSILKDLKKSKSFNKKEPEEQKEICLNKFYDFALRVEREKLFYFSLIYCQTTVIVTAPKNNKEQKEFLGYDWSNRKGNEGIQIIAPGGKLYSDKDRLDTNTIAHAIKQSFLDEFPTLTAEQQKYTQIYSTKDLFNFSRSTFTKSISLSAAKAFISKSKYPLIVLKDIPGIKITKGSALTEAETTPDSGKYKVVAGGKTFAYMYEEYNRNAGVITISASGANAGFVNYWNEKIWASDCSTIEHDDKNILLWIYFYLKTFQTNINLLQRGQAQPHVYVEDIEAILIPDLNSISITSIVDKCKVILDNRRNIASVITNHKKRIEALYSELDNLSEDRTEYRLSDADGFNISIGKRVLNKDLIPNGQVPVYSANVKEPFGYLDKTLFEDFSKPSVLWGIDGDWITNLIPAETKFYPTDHCGVLRCNLPEINPLYLVHVLQQEGERIGFSRDYRASIDRIKGLTISVPKIDIQNTKINEIEKLKKKIEELELSLTDLENEVKTVIETSIH